MCGYQLGSVVSYWQHTQNSGFEVLIDTIVGIVEVKQSLTDAYTIPDQQCLWRLVEVSRSLGKLSILL